MGQSIENKKFVEITSEQIQSAVTDIQFGYVHEILKELALSSKHDQSKKSNNTQKRHDNEEDILDVKEGNVEVITENIGSAQEADINVSKTIAPENDKDKLVKEEEIKVSEPTSNENEVSCVNESLENKNLKTNSSKQNKKSKKKKSKNKNDAPSQNCQNITLNNSLKPEESAIENANKIHIKKKSDKKQEQWTEVKRSRKNKTISNQNSTKQEIIKSQEQTQIHSKDVTEEENHETSNTETVRPLEEMQNLFFEEKSVQIIEAPTPH